MSKPFNFLINFLLLLAVISFSSSVFVPNVKATTETPNCKPADGREKWVEWVYLPDNTIKTAEQFDIIVKFKSPTAEMRSKEYLVYLGDGNNNSGRKRIADDESITFTLNTPNDRAENVNLSLKTPGWGDRFGDLDVCNPLGKITIEPGRKTNCPSKSQLPPIPISVTPQSGSQSDSFKVTLHWEDLSKEDFEKYKDTDVNIYLTQNKNPDDPQRPRISGDTTDSSYGRTQKNAEHVISSISLPKGNYELFVYLSLDFAGVCKDYGKSTPSIKLTSTIGDPNAKPLEKGDYCDIEQQNEYGDPSIRCPADAPCKLVAGLTSGPYACGGREALCEVQKNCSWGGLPTPAKFATYTCDSSGNVGTGTAQCLKAGGVQCDPETGREGGVGGVSTAIGCIPTDPPLLIKKLLQFATGAGGGIALLLMIFGAFQWITSTGNPDSMKKAQDQFTNAAIGLLFIIFSIMILKIIGVDILQIPGFTK